VRWLAPHQDAPGTARGRVVAARRAQGPVWEHPDGSAVYLLLPRGHHVEYGRTVAWPAGVRFPPAAVFAWAADDILDDEDYQGEWSQWAHA